MIELLIKKIHRNAVIPKYTLDGDAAMDLWAVEIVEETKHQITYSFGICLEIPKGYAGLLLPRSSVKNYPQRLANSVGLIDSNYRGEVKAVFDKKNPDQFQEGRLYLPGERCAQLLIIEVPLVKVVEVSELTDTLRGAGGFGHTGTGL